jgi:hypothetical protein
MLDSSNDDLRRINHELTRLRRSLDVQLSRNNDQGGLPPSDIEVGFSLTGCPDIAELNYSAESQPNSTYEGILSEIRALIKYRRASHL